MTSFPILIKTERKLLNKGVDLSADILKVAHHGSRYSTTLQFLQKVKPIAAVISVGKNNPYGHPAEDVLIRLQNMQVSHIFRTDIDGDVRF